MGRLNWFLTAFAMLVTAAVVLSACGGGEDAKLLPGTTANQINSNLDQVRSLVSEEDCIGAENAAASVSEEIDALEGVDPKLKAALREGAERLNVVVGECEETEALEETESEALEEAEEAEREAEEEAEEKPGKGPKHKAEKEVEEEVPNEKEEGSSLPPNSNGKGGEKGQGEGPPEAGGETPSGGIGPGAPVGEG